MNFRGLTLALLLALALAACGGGADNTPTTGVASASDLDETQDESNEPELENTAETGDTAPATAEEAALALAACMRESGFDAFPDPQIDENGNVNLRAAIAESGVDFQDDGFREQIATCRDEVGAENFGAGARGEQREAIQEQLLTYTQCLRDQGLDVGDLDLAAGPGAGQRGEGGPGGDGAQGGDGAGRGQAQGNDGNVDRRAARIARALGLDLEDPATSEAIAACDEVLAEAFAGLGVGQPPAANEAT